MDDIKKLEGEDGAWETPVDDDKTRGVAGALRLFCDRLSDDPDDYPDRQLWRIMEECREIGLKALDDWEKSGTIEKFVIFLEISDADPSHTYMTWLEATTPTRAVLEAIREAAVKFDADPSDIVCEMVVSGFLIDREGEVDYDWIHNELADDGDDFKIFVPPDARWDECSGGEWWNRQKFIRELRRNKRDPDYIQFLADMLEK